MLLFCVKTLLSRRHKQISNWLLCLNYIQTFGINAVHSSIAALQACRHFWRFKSVRNPSQETTNRPEIDVMLLPCFSIKAGSKGITIKPNERITNQQESFSLCPHTGTHHPIPPQFYGPFGCKLMVQELWNNTLYKQALRVEVKTASLSFAVTQNTTT